MTAHDIAQMRRHCRAKPGTQVELPAEDLAELIDAWLAEKRRARAPEDHLRRRHGCRADCWGAKP